MEVRGSMFCVFYPDLKVTSYKAFRGFFGIETHIFGGGFRDGKT